MTEPRPEFFDEPMSGEIFEATEDSFEVRVFDTTFRAFPPPQLSASIQICPACGGDCRQSKPDLWVCEICGRVEDNRSAVTIINSSPRRRRRRKAK